VIRDVKSLTDQILGEADFTKAECEAFAQLGNSPAYGVARAAMARASWGAAELAMEDGNLEFWQGYREGLNMVFALTATQGTRFEDFLKEALVNEAKWDAKPFDEEEPEPAYEAISNIGGSDLGL
jgi:hypothetical protein